MESSKVLEQQQDRIDELEAEKRNLSFRLEESEQVAADLREQLSTVREAYDQLMQSQPPRAFRGSDEENVYLASSIRKHFHRPNCEWAAYISSSSNLIEFSSHREAVQAGYKPCKTCRA